jgi:lactate dehydrogenase-like 2-hydroxyacid dehydrogenase
MPDAEVLAIGNYSETDSAALAGEFGARLLPDLAALAALPPAQRAAVRAVALKGHAPFGAGAMDLLPALALVANFGVGVDAIDLAAAAARGIAVTNTPDVLTDDVADLAVGMILAQGRRLVQGDAWVRSGDWARRGEFPLNRTISGGRAGILGLGRIGRATAERLAAFRMAIHYWSRSPKDVPEGWVRHETPEALAAAVDWLVVTTVGGAETRGLVSAAVIAALGPGGVLVNVARGSVVDEEALIAALAAGRLGGAALDVFAREPDVDARLLAFDTVLLQPHQGSGTAATRAAMGRLQRANIAAFLAGQPLPTPVG